MVAICASLFLVVTFSSIEPQERIHYEAPEFHPPHINHVLYFGGKLVTIETTPPASVQWENSDLMKVVSLVRRTWYNEEGEVDKYFSEQELLELDQNNAEGEQDSLLLARYRNKLALGQVYSRVRHLSEINLLMPLWFLGEKANTRFNFIQDVPEYFPGLPVDYYTIPLYIKSSRPRSFTDISLVTQCSFSRLEMIVDIGKTWDGVLSLAIYIQNPLTVPLIPDLLESFAIELEASNPRLRLDISLLFGARFSPQFVGREVNPYDFAFPVNALRNLALDFADTEFVLYIDCDFLPSGGMHQFLTSREVYQEMKERSEARKSAFVVPVFEMLSDFPLPLPFTRKDLDELCFQSLVVPFHSKLKIEGKDSDFGQVKRWCLGEIPKYHIQITDIQKPTNYSRWLTAREMYPPDLSEKYLNRYYEPYMVAMRSSLPKFEECFRGYSFNKRAQMIELQYAGFDMQVLPEVFLTHRFHEHSIGKHMMGDSVMFRETVKKTYQDLQVRIRGRYPGKYQKKKAGKGSKSDDLDLDR